MPKPFDPKEKVNKRTYIVEGLLALSSFNFLLGQSGTGKTYLALWLGLCAAHGVPFLGLETKKMKVLIVSQDQSEVDTRLRIEHFRKHLKLDGIDEGLLIHNTEDGVLKLKDGSLAKVIKESGANLVIVDSLTTVSEGLSMSNEDMRALKKLYQNCVNSTRTILILHHISEHKFLTRENLPTVDPADLTMWGSIINQTSDANFLLVNVNKGFNNKELYLRCVMKRYRIEHSIVKFGMNQTKTSAYFGRLEDIVVDSIDLLTNDERIVLAFFEDKEQGEWEFVNTIESSMQGVLGINKTRELLKVLNSKEFLEFAKEGPNRFKYCLSEKGREYFKSRETCKTRET